MEKFSHLESSFLKFSPTIVFLEVLELVLVDDDDGGALLPEGAGLVLDDAVHGGGLLVFMGVECFFSIFLSGDLVFSSSSCFLLSLLCDGVVMVWCWSWCAVCLDGVWGVVGVVVSVTVSRMAWAWPWWSLGLPWWAGPLLVCGDNAGCGAVAWWHGGRGQAGLGVAMVVLGAAMGRWSSSGVW